MQQEPHAGAPGVHGSEPDEPTETTPKSQRAKHRWQRDKCTRTRSTFVRPSVRRALLKAEPNCRACGNPATEIDHVRPICRGGRHHPSNWQPLCRLCHRRKTGREGAWCRWRRKRGEK